MRVGDNMPPMTLPKTLCLIVLLSCLTAPARAQRKGQFDHLKTWANESSSRFQGKREVSFFMLPEIRRPLTKLLGGRRFTRLRATFELENPIEIISGYLVLEGWQRQTAPPGYKNFAEPYQHAVVAVGLDDGSIHVGIRNEGRQEWYSTGGKYTDLVYAIRDRIKN